MNVSRHEQRVLHALAQGGAIQVLKDEQGKLAEVACYSREGFILPDFTPALFRKLKARQAIASSEGRPYRITRAGLKLVRAQLDNR
jgi:uncharacterized protein YjhX (UPF0386 family)